MSSPGRVVPNDKEAPHPRRLGKGRMEAFSDGVFSIAATLLVLDIAVHPPGSPLDQVLEAWPTYVAYVVSFLTIGAGWLGHTALTDRVERVDPIFLRVNLLLLMVVAFLPFPTHLVAEGLHHVDGERVAVTLYGATLLTIRLLGFSLDRYAKHEQLYGREGEGAELEHEGRQLVPVVAAYILAILIGLILPGAAVAIYFGLAVYLVVPFREVRRIFRRSPS